MFPIGNNYANGTPSYTNNVQYWQYPDATACVPYAHSYCQTVQYLTKGSLSDDFHTYSLYWSPNKLTFFFDGREVRTVTDPKLTSLQNPMHIIAMLAMDGYGHLNEEDAYESSHIGYKKMDVDWIRVLKPLSGDTPNDYSSTPYKTSQEWIHDKVRGLNTTTDIAPTYRSIAYNTNTNTQAFYIDANSKLQLAYRSSPTATKWLEGTFTYPYNSSLPNGQPGDDLVKSDVVYNAFEDIIVYRGRDLKLQFFKNQSGSWQHGWIDNDPNSLLSKVSNTPGSIVINPSDGSIYFKTTQNVIRRYYKNAGVWTYDPVITTAYSNADKVLGDLCMGSGGQLYYKNNSGILKSLYPCSGGYCLSTIDVTGAYPAMIFPGCIGVATTGLNSQTPGDFIFYIGADQQIHQYYGNATAYGVPPTSWTHSATTALATDALAYGDIAVGNRLNVYYLGNDGRIQQLYQQNNSPTWNHRWIDDYFNTKNYLSYSANNATSGSSNLYLAGGAVFYRTGVEEATTPTVFVPAPDLNKLGYFSIRGGEVLNPNCASSCTNSALPYYLQNRGTGTSQALATESSSTVQGFEVFPVPAKSDIKITYRSTNPTQVIPYLVSDLFGKAYLKGNCKSGSTISIESLAPGSYILSARIGDKTYHKKLVKE